MDYKKDEINKNGANDNATLKRRRFPRRTRDVCMVNVDGHPYPVVDWSQCGVLFEADTRTFSEGQTVNMILRFKLDQGIEDVKVTGEIVRTNSRAVATTFTETPKQSFEAFEKVIERSAA